LLGKTWDVVVIGSMWGSQGDGVEFTKPNRDVREMSETGTVTANDHGEEGVAVGHVRVCVLNRGVDLWRNTWSAIIGHVLQKYGQVSWGRKLRTQAMVELQIVAEV
jgi:hypothetical protein